MSALWERVKARAAELEAALRTVKGTEYTGDLGANLNPPTLILGPPALRWETFAVDPSNARFLVYAVVPADDRAAERLMGLVPLAAEAIDELTDAAVITADPATYVTGVSQLPCYEITVECPL